MFQSRLAYVTGILISILTLFSAVLLAAPASASDCGRYKTSTVSLASLRNGEPESAGDEMAAPRVGYRNADDDPCSLSFRDRHHQHHHRREKRERFRERHAVDLYGDGFGVNVALGPGRPGWHLSFSQAEAGADSLDLRLGLMYRIPEPFLLWHFYGGGGFRYTVPELGAGSYFVTGTEFLFLFWEHGYTFGRGDETMEKFDRAGLRFRF